MMTTTDQEIAETAVLAAMKPGTPEYKKKVNQRYPADTFHGVTYLFEGEQLTRKDSGRCRPTEQQDEIARTVLADLHDKFSYDGHWVLFWKGPVPNRWDKETRMFHIDLPLIMEIMWFDRDGDAQFTVEVEKPVSQILDEGFDTIYGQCTEAHKQWKHLTFDVLEIKPSDTYQAAKGETAPSLKR